MDQPAHDDAESVERGTCRSNTFHLRQLPSDIDVCLPFSLLRCVISMISIGLVLTDIPRTGLFINLLNYYPKIGPDLVMYYGPYAYPIAHLNRTNDTDIVSVSGYTDESPIHGLDIWPYKFDSLSIPTRALAEHLNVSSYPPCVLYQEHCTSSTLALETVFNMLDDLMTAIDNRYFTQQDPCHLPTVFYTTSNWADRLHHVILGKLGYRIDVRMHAVYRFAVTKAAADINVCDQYSAAESHHPLMCKSPVEWGCDHPFVGTEEQIAVVESIQLRVARLQQNYPDAELEVMMITSRNELKSQHHTYIPVVFYRSDSTEITTLIRGRECRTGGHCKTIFIDDYRYERGTLETSSESIHYFTSALRAASQMYVWLRIVLLLFICYRARVSEPKFRKKPLSVKLRAVALTLVKIPSHSIIFTSWIPIVGYSVAHFTDCGLTHLIGDTFWASANGLFSFDFFKYIKVSSIQMRNMWIIALLWKCAITIYNRFFISHKGNWKPQHGLLVFRGLVVTLTSFLTMFTFLRALHFRDTRVLSFGEVQRNRGASNEFLTWHLHKGPSDFGYQLDVKTTTTALAIVVGIISSYRWLTQASRKAITRSFFCHTFYVPLSTGVLFSTSALIPLWYMELFHGHHLHVISSETTFSTSPLGPTISAIRSNRRQCGTCDFVASSLHWKAVQGCPRHETLFDIGRRTKATQSMVRLIHIAVFSDPIVFFQLRVLGRQLYLYRIRDRFVHSGDERRTSPNVETDTNNWTTFLSPIPLYDDGSEDSNGSSVKTSGEKVQYELIGRVNSASVPWAYLVDCG